MVISIPARFEYILPTEEALLSELNALTYLFYYVLLLWIHIPILCYLK